MHNTLYKYKGRIEGMDVTVNQDDTVSFTVYFDGECYTTEIDLPLEEARKLASAIFRHYLFEAHPVL